MVSFVQLALVAAFVLCWAIAISAYSFSRKHKRPGVSYAHPWTSDGLTERGKELRRIYWRSALVGVAIATALLMTFVVWPQRT